MKTKAISPVFLDTRTRNNLVKKILLAVAALLALIVIIATTSAYAAEKEQDITCTISQRTAPIFYLLGPRAKVEWPVIIKAKDTDDAILKIMRLVFSENDKDRDVIYNKAAEEAYAEYRKTLASRYSYPRILKLLVFGNELQDESFSVSCPMEDDMARGKIVVDVRASMIIDSWGNE